MTGRSSAPCAAERQQLARDRVARQFVAPGKRDQLLERRDRVAACAEIERDEVGLAARKNRDRRRVALEMAAVVELGQTPPEPFRRRR